MTRVAVFGAGGYTGAELVRLLCMHPSVELVSVHGSERSVGADVADLVPELRGICDMPMLSPEMDPDAEVVMLATPHEVSAQLGAAFLTSGRRVIDLSGAFRFDSNDTVERVYGFRHADERVLSERVYGMPEVVDADWTSARIVACAGCYVTASSIPLRALAQAGVVDTTSPVLIDAISGVSGAGRAASVTTSFCEVSATPYKVWSHRHAPEIEMVTGASVLFTPMLGPWKRGILATVHAALAPNQTGLDVARALDDAYGDEPFVRFLPEGMWPSVGAVERTNCMDVAWAVDERYGRVVLFSAIDNLMKGASGQAVQCLNLMLGLDVRTGLLPLGAKEGVL